MTTSQSSRTKSVAAQEQLGITPRPCQLAAAELLEGRCVVEMQTGEGKTLVAGLAAWQIAQSGRRIFIATANDYLAMRDAAAMEPLYQSLRIDCGAIVSSLSRSQRGAVYQSAIVYGTIRELGFDVLRDALSRRRGEPTIVPTIDQLIVDEADSVLVDEATTPLVISDPARVHTASSPALLQWAAQQSTQLRFGDDFEIHLPSGGVALTDRGLARIIHREMPVELNSFTMPQILQSLERAIDALLRWQRDVHYVVRDDQIVLVDEYTGRAAAGKTLGDGLHQAIETKEGVPLSLPAHGIARMTIQELVNQIPRACGLTATACEDAAEFRRVYGLSVKRIAPHVASKQRTLRPQFCQTQAQKRELIVADIRAMQSAGRSVLIGTRTILRSNSLAAILRDANINHVVLNAHQSQDEASIVAMAGQAGRVTVATNMAGRGTDIELSDHVRAAGGLHVIVSEPHAAARIDRQLAGRCARQGDPGTVRHFFAADDELFEVAYGASDALRIANSFSKTRLASQLQFQAKLAQRTLRIRAAAVRQALATSEAQFAADIKDLGLDPHLDRF